MTATYYNFKDYVRTMSALAPIFFLILLSTSAAFQPVHNKCHTFISNINRLCRIPQRSTLQVLSSDDDVSDDSDLFDEIANDAHFSNDIQNEMLSELQWRSKKVSLEEENTERFKKRLKAKPWKLPIEESRKWVYANFGAETKEEFLDLVENGNLRTPYVPKDPERYYSENGTWISWQHFLSQDEGN